MDVEELRKMVSGVQPSGIRGDVSVRFQIDELKAFSPQQTQAFMRGIADVIATQRKRDPKT